MKEKLCPEYGKTAEAHTSPDKCSLFSAHLGQEVGRMIAKGPTGVIRYKTGKKKGQVKALTFGPFEKRSE
jgi:hypothetical protein